MSKAVTKAKKSKARVPAVVPKVVFGATFIGVIPACVAMACGGATDGDSSKGSTSGLTVAMVGYVCKPTATTSCGDAANPCGDEPCATVATIGFTVAAMIVDSGVDAADDASDDATTDASTDAGDADAGD